MIWADWFAVGAMLFIAGGVVFDGGRYFPGSGYPVQIKREYAHVCVPCETALKYGPLEERDAVAPRKPAEAVQVIEKAEDFYGLG